jgi:hypothetical protein
MSVNESMPRWDVALAALAADAYRKKAAPLTLEDFQNLAREHAIRFDDIMETLFLLVIHGVWSYHNPAGEHIHIDQQTLDGLYVKRRLSEADLSAYTGGWQPL